METATRNIRRGLTVLARQGVHNMIVTADHGYLFGEEAGTDMTINPPGGETVDLHRRVWIGRGGAANDSCVRMKASDLGWGGDLEIVAPWNMACFKAGGAKAYFHGGLAPQEIVVPVAVLRALDAPTQVSGSTFEWELHARSIVVSTRFLSVQISGRAAQLFDAAAPRVRVEVRIGSTLLSSALTADYGLDEGTGEIALGLDQDGRAVQPNLVVLRLDERVIEADSVTVHLVDAASGSELARLAPIPVRISL